MRSATERRVGAIGFCAALTLGLFFLWADFSPTMGQESQRTEGTSTQRRNEDATKLTTWRKSMARVPLPKKGCFRASYPNTEWQEVPCVKAPSIPFQVGDGDAHDFSVPAGSISSVTGSFMSVTGVTGFTDETDTVSGTMSSYSLQLNTNQFLTPTACSGAKDPSMCRGAQQFIFANNLPIGESGNCVLGGNSCVYVQYWLINWAKTCPTGWYQYVNDCYTNFEAASIPGALSITNLQSLVLQGQATGGMDQVTLTCAPTVSSAACTSLLGSDMVSEGEESVLNLQGQWTDAEFNVFGNGNGSQARFNSPTTIVVQTAVDDGSTNQPVCKPESLTGETNSLSLVTCCPYGGSGAQLPSIEFMETSAGETATCGATAILGDTHITTANGVHYNFQAAGEFISLRDSGGDEIQTRQTAVSTTFIGEDPYDGLTTCVSLNTAVAARVGEHRVTYEPDLSGTPDPSGMQLRIDGVLTTLGLFGRDLGNGGGRVFKSLFGGGLEIDFPDGKILFVTPEWWNSQGYWYLNVDVTHLDLISAEGGGSLGGIGGPIANGSWLPALPSGASLGPIPASLQDRYDTLYSTFADAWRVTDKDSLFDYAPGTSTDTFTLKDWPKQNPPCIVRDVKPVAPASEAVAEQACRRVWDQNMHADCVFDVMATGNTGFATMYLDTQRTLADSTAVSLTDDADPSQIGEWVAFTAYVAANSMMFTGFPSGTVQFSVDGSNVGEPITVDAKGRAVWQTSQLKVGKHWVAASYIPGADSEFLPSASVEKLHVVKRCHCGAERD
jgi:Bacterial Ig-like domain (group 3)